MGTTALGIACYQGNFDLVRLLIQKSASIDIINNAGISLHAFVGERFCHYPDAVSYIQRIYADEQQELGGCNRPVHGDAEEVP
ncbi:hypothetical protein PHMEG_00018173 [Phytophthora megakarya]|uniref:Uncharacterized protein n=1 Tax=Phytophthora megakarya TaxID=4795 RepID=A0A225VWI5_9STRA|nr:hypothetical protein PHMEG_00018173 [Phytophthora megakarya]